MQNINVSSSKILRLVRALYCDVTIWTRGVVLCSFFVVFFLACREQLGQINDNCKKKENFFFTKNKIRNCIDKLHI